MSRSYQHISKYENEILELKSQGLTLKEIGERLGFTRKQVHSFICRYNEKERLNQALQLEQKADQMSLKEYIDPFTGSENKKA